MRIAGPPTSCKVYTASDLADAIVKAVGDTSNAMWLEPSHGSGAFVQAIAHAGVERKRIVAIDLDNTVANPDRLAKTLRGVDFLRWAGQTTLRFERIVGNPPYISINQLPLSLRRSAAAVHDPRGRAIGTGANTWYAFVSASLQLLRKGGCLAFILPSAAEFADYCEPIRRSVVGSFGKLELYRCAQPLFDDVQEGCLIVVAREFGKGPGVVVRKFYQSRSDLISGLSKSAETTGRKCPTRLAVFEASRMTLGDVARIRLGGVTGDADYFLMNESKRTSLKLPVAACTPVVSKAKHLRSACLTREEWQRLKIADERVWLFSPPPEIASEPNVTRYLRLKLEHGGCNRDGYKVSIRNPWYRTPLPSVPDAFLSGMSQHGPWLCINETRNTNATNTLYAVTFNSRSRNDWYTWALALLSTGARRQVRHIGRRYADGLMKYEPGAIGRIVLPQLKPEVDHRSLYVEAVNALRDGNLRLARKIADSVLA